VDKTPPLYDSKGRLIPPTVRNGPPERQPSKPRNTPPIKSRRPQERQGPQWKKWLTGWRLALELSPCGLLLAIYTLYPVLSPGSPNASDLHADNGVKVMVSVLGSEIRM
jgi:hypothetical protein